MTSQRTPQAKRLKLKFIYFIHHTCTMYLFPRFETEQLFYAVKGSLASSLKDYRKSISMDTWPRCMVESRYPLTGNLFALGYRLVPYTWATGFGWSGWVKQNGTEEWSLYKVTALSGSPWLQPCSNVSRAPICTQVLRQPEEIGKNWNQFQLAFHSSSW